MERLIEQIADANNKRYGRSSEKLETISGQMELELIFNEAEALTETLYVVEPAEEDVIQPRHRKSKGKREADLKDLPVEVISHTLSEEKLRDVFGTDGWKQLPDEIYKRVRVQPAVYTVEEHHVAVYAGRDNQTIIKADRPKDLLRNSLLTPSLAASIMNAKYVNGLPLYRISQEFLRNDIHISRQVMANWMIQCADRYLGILYDRLHRELYQFHVLQADETPVMVTKDGRPVNSKSYMWIYRTGKSYTDTPIILYEYQRTRKADHPEEFLKDFKGIVVCDGYSAYRKLDRKNPDIVFAGCWSHARRRFAEALKALPKAVQKKAKETIADEAVSRIAAIYHLDNQMEGQPAKEMCIRDRGKDVITDPKTPKSKRNVSMPDFLCEELKDYIGRLYGILPTDRIFHLTKSFLHHEMTRGAKKAGVKRIRIHDLRHSHVSLLISMGFSAVSIGNRVGHESVDITYRYAHMFPTEQTQMAKLLDEEFKEGAEE